MIDTTIEKFFVSLFFLGIGGYEIYSGWRMQKGGFENLNLQSKITIWLNGVVYGVEKKEELTKLVTDPERMKLQGKFEALLGFIFCILFLAGMLANQ